MTTQFVPKLFSIIKNGYSKTDLRSDIIAGLTVAIVALPLSMALAIASGTSPDKGLITAIIAGFLISFLGGSRVQIGGPTGAFVVVVFNVIAQHGYDGLLLATIIAGLILIVSGFLKLGQTIKFIPHSVVTGFTAGIAVIIASSQIKDFFGLKLESVPAEFIPKWVAYFQHINTTDMVTLSLGVGSLLTILLLRRFYPKLPSYLIAVVLSVLIVSFWQIPVDTIGSRFPDMSISFGMPSLPTFTFAKLQQVLPSAFIIAFLAGIEALLSAMVADGMTGYRHRSNIEIVGQGVANLTSALFGGLPATGAIARTAANIKSGAKTPFAGMFHALFLFIFVLFGADLIKYVPMVALSAILLVVAWGMSEIHHFIHIFRVSKYDALAMLLTFVLTVFVDLTVGIAVGVISASLIFMQQMSKYVELTPDNVPEEDDPQRGNLPKGVEVFRIMGPLFFGVANDLIDTLRNIGSIPKIVILRMALVPYLDVSGTKVLVNIIHDFHHKGTKVILSGLREQPKEILNKAGIRDGENGVILTADYPAALKFAANLIEIQ